MTYRLSLILLAILLSGCAYPVAHEIIPLPQHSSARIFSSASRVSSSSSAHPEREVVLVCHKDCTSDGYFYEACRRIYFENGFTSECQILGDSYFPENGCVYGQNGISMCGNVDVLKRRKTSCTKNCIDVWNDEYCVAPFGLRVPRYRFTGSLLGTCPDEWLLRTIPQA